MLRVVNFRDRVIAKRFLRSPGARGTIRPMASILPTDAPRPIIPLFQARRIPMIVLRPAAAGLPCVTMWLKPNRTLSHRGLRRLIMVLAALALITAGLGAWQGNVFAPLFALVESAAVAIALSVAWRAGDRSERITLDALSLEVRAQPGRRCTRFQSYWVRVKLEPGDGRDRLLLSSHGRELEIGAFLAEQERVELSKKLMVLLADVNGPPREQVQQRCKT
jgi:uncharacterized membrane protein